MAKQIDVLAVLADYSAQHGDPEDFEQARAVVAELIRCSDVTVNAFEALGRSSGIVDQLEAQRNCERALIEQKSALARCRGEA